jgi:hypothetical protein
LRIGENDERLSWLFIVVISVLFLGLPVPYSADSVKPPDSPQGYALNRADEDYRYLADPARHTDIWDPLNDYITTWLTYNF